ncbi:MAG: sigma-70 family RNA polymerase sigma factor [Lachnospiraceae bacterium]|nr:sigma-70 family RNA polymerase sigma factor [Lachnospiraceae bacterium]
MEQEQKWIRKIQRKGSREAADCLIRAYYDEIYRFVYRQVGDKEDAMDLTQNIFVAVLRSLPEYRPRRACFRTWLYAVANNKIIDARRKVQIAQITAYSFEELEPPANDDFVSRIQDRMFLAQIEKYVSGQALEQQKVFRLRVYAGLSFPEIAETLGEQEAAVKARYYRLVEKIRKEFSDYEG